MRISAGISEISFGPQAGAPGRGEKIYLWPVYGEGRVERIQGVTRRTEGNAVYSKPLPEEREKLFDLAEKSRMVMYTPDGRADRKTSVLRPGSFFEAIV